MKNILTIYLLIFSLLTFGQSKTQIGTDTVIIGKPGSTANKRIKLGTQEIRSNTTTSKLEYTHDGITYKPVGSGSGAGGSSGGINLLANDSFEDPITTGWQNTGGTLTQEAYEFGTETDAKFARFVATAAGQYFESTLVTVPNNFTGGCQADFKKVNVSADDLFKIEILDSSSNVLSTGTVKKLTQQRFPTISTPCPTPGSQFRIRVTSLAAGTFEGDFGYLGSNQNLVSVAQAKLVGAVVVTNCAANWSTTSTTYTDLGAQTGCIYTTYGSALAPSTNIPAFRFASLPPGDYKIEYEGSFGNSTANQYSFAQFSDGTNTARETSTVLAAASTYAPSISQTISYGTTQSNVTLSLKGKVSSGSTMYLSGTNLSPGTFRLWYFPSSTETAVNTDQASWFIDANIGGGNASLGTVNVTSYTEIASSVLDLVLNPGSAQAKIACSGTNPSTGLTCSTGNESIGITFTPPYAGKFEVCTQFTWEGVSSSGGNLNVAFQNVLTANSSQTIIEEGKERASAQVNGLQYNQSKPFRVCGHFTFNDTSEKTVRLMYEQAQGPSTSSLIMADRSATVGQRDIHITVKPVLSAYNRPILLENPIIKASYYLGSNGSYGNSQAINFDIKEYDSHNAVTIGSAWKFTTPANGAGVYSVLVYGTATASVVWKIYKNGSQYKTLCQNVVSSSACMGSTNILLNDGDYIDIRPDTASVTVTGGTLSSNTATIAITRVGK